MPAGIIKSRVYDLWLMAYDNRVVYLWLNNLENFYMTLSYANNSSFSLPKSALMLIRNLLSFINS